MNKNDTQIRRYSEQDIPVLIPMIERTVPTLPHYKNVKMERSRIKFLLDQHVHDESAYMVYVLTNKRGEIVGYIAAWCVTLLVSWDKTTGDIFLWIEPEHRTIQNVLKLMRAYVDWGKRRGATLIQATHTSGYRPEEMAEFLSKYCGFELVGYVYHLRVSHTGAKS